MRKTVTVLAAAALALALAGAAGAQTTPPPSERGGTLPGAAAALATADDWSPRAMFLSGTVRAIQGPVIALDMGRPGSVASELPPSGSSLGAVRINTDASTRFYVPGVVNPALADLNVGNRVIALAERRAAGGQTGLWAKGVTVLPDPVHVYLVGEATNLGAGGFQLTRRGAQALDVQVNGATKVIVPGQPAGVLAEGDRVALRGVPLPGGGIRAEIVLVNPLDRDHAINGIVASLNGTALVIWTQRGDSVDVDAASAVFARPDESLATLRVGQPVRAIGIWNAARTAMTAQLIGDLNGGPGPGATAPAAPAQPVPRQNRQP